MNRSGKYVNNMEGDSLYKSFLPSPLLPELNLDNETLKTLINATRCLQELDAEARYIPNTSLFISMYVRKEALITSQIEGTQCTLDDIFDPQLDVSRNLDAGDVINYVKAVSFALKRRKKLPLCNRFLREIHAKLMDGVRGEDKNPGEFRRSQNWIGAKNCSLKDARYIPPNVEDMNNAMNDLEKYINEDSDFVKYDPLIQAALIHYQFETIHPFLDGNGRIGRLLILLFLMEKNLLSKPVIYVSYFLKKNQLEYYDRISEVRKSGNYEQWINFFLEAVAAAAKDSITTINSLSEMHDRNVSLLPESSRGVNSCRKVFDYIEQSPIIDIKSTAEKLNLSYNTVSGAIKKLTKLGILEETTNASRNRVFAYKEYLEILRKDT